MLLARDIALGGSKCRGNNDKRAHGGNGWVPCSSMNFTLSCNFVSIGSWYFLEDWYESIVFVEYRKGNFKWIFFLFFFIERITFGSEKFSEHFSIILFYRFCLSGFIYMHIIRFIESSFNLFLFVCGTGLKLI